MISWIQNNLPMLLGILSAVGAASGAAAPFLPAGTVRKVLLVLGHLLPANVVGALQAIQATEAPAPASPPKAAP